MRVPAFLVLLLGVAISASISRAAVDAQAASTSTAPYELIVLEADGCTYCSLFRRDVLPAFEASDEGRQMTVRFLDINNLEAANLDLQSGVDIVPTFIVIKKNKEIGRIPGYLGSDYFFHAIKDVLSSAP